MLGVVCHITSSVMLDRVEDAWDIVWLNTECHCKIGQGTSVDTLMRLWGQLLEDFEEAIVFCELFQGTIVEPQVDGGGQNALNLEKAALDLLELVQHGQDHLFLEV